MSCPPTPEATLLRRAARCGAGVAFGLGACTLLGWAVGELSLGRIVPGQPVMKPNTAVAFMASATSVWLLSRECVERLGRIAALVGGGLVLALGVTVLGEYLTGGSAGIGELLFDDPVARAAGASPGRFAPPTAAGLALIGLALALQAAGVKRRGAVTAPAAATAVVGLSNSIALAAGEPQVVDGIPVLMAAPTAVGLFLLGAAVVVSRPERTLPRLLTSPGAGGRLARRALPAGLALPVVVGLTDQLVQADGFTRRIGVDLFDIGVVGGLVLLLLVFAERLERADRERGRAGAALEQSQRRTRAIIDTAHHAFVSIDQRGVILEWNPSAEETFGWSREEAVGLELTATIIPPEVHAAHSAGLRRFLATGEGRILGQRLELTARHRDGHELPVEITISPLRTDEGWCFNAFLQNISERRLADAELRSSEARFRALATQAPGGIYETDVDGGATFTSERWCEIAGITQEQAHGHGWIDSIHSDDLEGVVQEWIDALRENRDFEREYRLVRPDGEIRWVSGTATPVRDDGGDEVTGFLGSCIDVTERRRAEADSRLQAEIAANMGEGVCLVRMSDASVVYANRRFEQMLGYEPGELDGVHVSALNAEGRGGTETRLRSIQAGLADTGHWSGHVRNVRKDGTELWCQLNVSTFEHDELGAVSVAVHTDVTEQRRAEVARDEAEARFRGAFESAPIGMALASLAGDILEANEALAKLTGRSRQELERTSFAAVTHPDDRADHLVAVEALVAGRVATHTAEQRFLHMSGAPVWVSTSVVLVRDRAGAPGHLIVQAQDITERRGYERRLQHMAHHDALTGLLNRRGFDRELERHVERALRYGAEGALLVLDLDCFKHVNDTFGHGAGDKLIARVASALRQTLRGSDMVARLGGDEFAILLPKADTAAARTVAVNLCERLRRERVADAGESGSLSASIGVAVMTGPADLRSEALMVMADAAMYEAKEAGRDRVAVYERTARPPRADAPRLADERRGERQLT